jgi:hypothetical protein
MPRALRDLQRGFAEAVLTRNLAGFAHAIAPGRFAPAQHLQVYRNNIAVSLAAALEAVYPVVARLVGTDFFGYMADQFIRRHPPASGNLHDFGGELAAFLAGFAPAAQLAYLADVARLEWAWHEAFHAADHDRLDLARLVQVPAERYAALRFVLHPSARLIASAYPIQRILQANQPAQSGDEQVDLATGPVRLLVIRRALDVEIEMLEVAEYAFLSAVAERMPLEAACAQALAADPAFDVTQSLRDHVLRGTVVDVDSVGNQQNPKVAP